MPKKKTVPTLPTPDEKGFFQTPHDVKIGGRMFAAGSWLKVLAVSSTGKTWFVRGKFHKNDTAVNVRSSIFLFNA